MRSSRADKLPPDPLHLASELLRARHCGAVARLTAHQLQPELGVAVLQSLFFPHQLGERRLLVPEALQGGELALQVAEYQRRAPAQHVLGDVYVGVQVVTHVQDVFRAETQLALDDPRVTAQVGAAALHGTVDGPQQTVVVHDFERGLRPLKKSGLRAETMTTSNSSRQRMPFGR